MESESAANRRINLIASHFAATVIDDISASPPLLPLNCSSNGINTVIRRGDNRVNFARQGSSSQAFFMKQVSPEQVIDDRSKIPTEYPAPLSRDSKIPKEGFRKTATYDSYLNMIEPPPAFARPSKRINQQEPSYDRQKADIIESSGTKKSPRIHVAESGCNYVVTVEIPGVGVDDINVEIDDQNLIVASKGSKLTVTGGGESFPAYCRREVFQRMYKLIWPLPKNVNKDHVTAEIWNGLLQIVIPKL